MCWKSEREKEIHLCFLYQRSKHTWDDVSRKPLWATCYKEVFVACSYLLLWIRLWQLWSRRKLASIQEINVKNTSFPRYNFYPVQTSLSIHTVCVEADGVDVSHDISVAKFSVTNKWRSYTLRLGSLTWTHQYPKTLRVNRYQQNLETLEIELLKCIMYISSHTSFAWHFAFMNEVPA